MNRNNIQKNLFKILAVFVFIAPLIALAQTPVLPQVVLLDRIQTHESISMKFNILALSSENQLISLEAHYGLEPERLDKTTPPFWTGIPTTSGTIANLEIKNLSSSTTYYYKIFKKDDAGSIEIPNSDNSFQTTSKNGQILTGTNTTVTSTCVKGQYCLLAPLPGIASYDVKKGNVGEYLNTLFKIGIGIAGVLAVVMLVLGAIQYMSSDSISEKGAGRERMTNAIIGLILALGSIVLLRTLNNNLTIIKLNIDEVSISVDPASIDSDIPESSPTNGKYCSAYQAGAEIATVFPAPTESAMRTLLANLGVTVTGSNSVKPICTIVGQTGCTAVQGLSNTVVTGLQKIKSKCPLCELTITGGSECWLHESHGPGKDKIDLRNTGASNLKKYVTSQNNGKKIQGWGTLYVVDNIEFVDEGDHYHIWGWNGDHASQYNK